MTESETSTNETSSTPDAPSNEAVPAPQPPASEAAPAPQPPATEAAPAAQPSASEAAPAAETPASQAAPAEPASAVESPPEAEAGEEEEAAPVAPTSGVYWGTGRRKSAIARVRLIPGGGKILINKRGVEEYFTELQEQLAVRESLLATKTEKSFDVFVNVSGGGHAGQAGAIRLGVARALVKANAGYEPALREKNYLTRDARVVERKKYGQRKARRRFQFSKR